MSEKEDVATEQVAQDSSDAGEIVPPKAETKIVEIHGKKFDISTPEGLLQAQAVFDVMSSVIGRQGQELGNLRKFVKDAPSPVKSELYKTAKAKAAEGDVDGAIESVLSYAEETQRKAESKIQAEKENAKSWDAYLDSRKALASVFGKSEVREISEAVFKDKLYDTDDPFSLLDEYWLPKVGKLASGITETPQAKEKPLGTLSSGQARPPAAQVTNTVGTSQEDFLAVLDSRKIRSKRSQPK